MDSATRLQRLTGLDRQGVYFGAATALAAWASFAIASLLHVQNAFWAPMAVWIVAQTSRGMLLERGVHRLAGTLVGAMVGFLLLTSGLPTLASILLLALWTALCGATSQLIRASLGYAAMMAGLTASVVLLPSLGDAGQVFTLALSRVESTLIGVLCVMLMGWLILPRPPRQQLLERVRRLAGEALARLASSAPSSREDGELLMALVEVEQQLAPTYAGPFKPSRGVRVDNAFVAGTLGLMAALRTMAGAGGAPDRRALQEALTRAATALKQPLARGSARDALAQASALARPLDRGLAAALDKLLMAEQAALAWRQGEDPGPLLARGATLVTRRDTRSALIAAAGSGLVTLAGGLFVFYSDWSNAWMPAMGLCTFTTVLSSMDLPQKVAPKMAQGVAVGVTLAALFRLLLMPHAGSLGEILLMLAPFMLLGGLARASTRTAIPALDGNMCFMLASQPFLSASIAVPDVLVDSAALLASILLVALVYRLLPRDPGRRAGHLARLILRDIERLCGQRGGGLDRRWHGRMFRRLLRLMLHLGRADRMGIGERAGLLGVLNLAHAIIALREERVDPRLTAQQRQELEAVLEALRRLAGAPEDARGRLMAGREQLASGGADAALMGTLDQAREALDDCAGLIGLAAPDRGASSCR
ncbi:FUSC family protein [Halomonas sp. 25-S5]|uniref:FUSC family protein n=1 Tax=Halomonas sp. 25-S5 TaxID=2994065 RepID=UPI00246824A5|nr:FUSC family protein [Halomonas sp. 25-S5]